MSATEKATRIATIATEYGKVSYWQQKEEVYRLNEYEPVQFDIYGLPLGARWETNFFHWPDLLKLLIPNVADHTNKACLEAQLERLAQ